MKRNGKEILNEVKNEMVIAMKDAKEEGRKEIVFEVIKNMAHCLVKESVVREGDGAFAAKAAVQGAIQGASELGLDAAAVASSAATSAVEAGYEIGPEIGNRIRNAVMGTISGIKVVLKAPYKF